MIAGLDKYTPGGKGGNDRGGYLRLYDGGHFTIDRITRGSFVVPNWSVACLLGGIQPDVIARIAKNAEEDGLLTRFLFDVPGANADEQDRAPDRAALGGYRRLFPLLAEMRPATWTDADQGTRAVPVTLHEDAHAAREDITALCKALANMPDVSPRLAGTFGKWRGLFGRLCLVFHLVEIAGANIAGFMGAAPREVPAHIAWRVANYMRAILIPNMFRADAVMFATTQTTHAKWVADYILAGRRARISARDIMRDYRALSAPEDRSTIDDVMDASSNALAGSPPKPRGAPPKRPHAGA